MIPVPWRCADNGRAYTGWRRVASAHVLLFHVYCPPYLDIEIECVRVSIVYGVHSGGLCTLSCLCIPGRELKANDKRRFKERKSTRALVYFRDKIAPRALTAVQITAHLRISRSPRVGIIE